MKRICIFLIFLSLIYACQANNYDKEIKKALEIEKTSRYLANEKYLDLLKKIKDKKILELIKKKIRINNAFIQFDLLNKYYKEYKQFIKEGNLDDRKIFADYKLTILDNNNWEVQVMVLEETLEDLFVALKNSSSELEIYENKYIREREITFEILVNLDTQLRGSMLDFLTGYK